MNVDLIKQSLIILTQALLLFFGVAYVYSFIPIHWSGEIPVGLEPERESFLYILLCLIIVGAVYFRRYFTVERFWSNLWLDGIFLSILTILFAKVVSYGHPFYPILLATDSGAWVKPLMGAVLFVALLSKTPLLLKVQQVITSIKLPAYVVFISTLLLIAFCLSVDTKVIEPLTIAVSEGQTLEKFLPAHWLLNFGLSYAQVAWVLIVAAFVLTALVGIFVYQWLGNFLLATIACLIVVKLGFFNYLQSPAFWLNPQTTPLVSPLNIAAIGAWLIYSRFNRQSWLIGVLIISAVAIISHMMLNSWVDMPVYQALRMRQFWTYFMIFVLPAGIFGVLVYGLHAYFIRRENRALILLVIVGLASVHLVNFIKAPFIGGYSSMAVEIALITVWLLSKCANRVKYLIVGAFCIALVALMTNRIFLAYPHVGNKIYAPLVSQYSPNQWQGIVNTIQNVEPQSRKLAIISPQARIISFYSKRSLSLPSDMLGILDELYDDGPCVLWIDKRYGANMNNLLDNITRYYEPIAQQPDGILAVYRNKKPGCQ